jgi:acetoin utilization deacetylase AcuC-like enzyme
MNVINENDSYLPLFEPEAAKEKDILRVHTPQHVNNVQKFCENGGGYLDLDTYASPESYNIAKLAAGGVITASKLILEGNKTSYSLVRPPGHHATANNAMGFCIFNNLAIGVEYLRKKHKIRKILIFDFDAHYGNGTAEIFYNDPDIMYISIHQDPYTIFPGKGFVYEMGGTDAEGANLNLPMPPGATTMDYIYILENVLGPIFKEFNADFFFFDVGFDAHQEDPLSRLQLDDYFFEWIAKKMTQLTDHRVLVLEGGYNLEAMSRANMKMINILNKEDKKDNWIEDMEILNIKEETRKLNNQIKNNFSPFFTF